MNRHQGLTDTMRQLPLPIGPMVMPRFERFVVGPNALALKQLDEASRPRTGTDAPPPIYLWGAQGTGKTYLLQALAARLQAQGEMVGLFGPTTELPWPIDDRLGALILDACDDLDAERQQAAFALFVDAIARGALVAAAGRVPPTDLTLRDDLRSRLGWGHVMALQPLSDADLSLVLRDEARRRGLALSDEVAAYVLTRHSRDLKSLMALLDRADLFALSQQRALTVPLLRQVLAEQDPVFGQESGA